MRRVKNGNWNQSTWEEYYLLLLEYYNENGNIDIHPKYKINGKKLGLWLNTQRRIYNDKLPYIITEEQISKLNELGMIWEERKSWDDYYILLEEYYEKHGNINVPESYEVNGIKLGSWLYRQRAIYNKKEEGILTDEQIDKLNKFGMKWNYFEDTWNENYKLLEEYYKEHGNINVTSGYVVNGVNLGSLIRTKRQGYKGNGIYKITDKEIVAYNKLNIDWSKWDTSFLNKPIKDMDKYNVTMLNRMKDILRDLTLEDINEIDSKETQEEIEKIIIKRMWR